MSRDKLELEFKLLKYFINEHENLTGERFYIVPGGSTPRGFYKLLSEELINWKNTTFILSDDRLVNIENNNSNEKHFFDNFYSQIKNKVKPNYISLKNDELYCLNNIFPEISILGFGMDGHTASIFSDFPINYITDKNVCTYDLKRSGENFPRRTLSFNFLLRSKKIIFILVGKEKANALKKCIYGIYQPFIYPAQYLLHNFANDTIIFCDKNAALEL